MRRLVIFCLLIAGLLPAFAQVAAVRDTAHPHLITVKNELLQLTIDLANGAHVIGYRYTGFNNEEIIHDVQSDNGGLFKDLWTTQGWPGELTSGCTRRRSSAPGLKEAVVKILDHLHREVSEYPQRGHRGFPAGEDFQPAQRRAYAHRAL